MRLLATFFLAAALALSSGVKAQVINAPATNGSVSITTGGTFQVVLAAVGAPPAIRRSLTINNNNATDACWIYLGSGTASKGVSLELLAGQSYRRDYPYVPSDEIQATCTTSADTLYVDTQ